MAPRKSIGIIGAGAAGICGAKHMLEAGFDVTVYEIGSQVGGMWVLDNDNGRSSAYSTLHINTARNLTNFSDFGFEASVPPFPSHRDMARYLKRYADHFGVTPRIRFRSKVAHLAPGAGLQRRTSPAGRSELAGGETRRARHRHRRDRPSDEAARGRRRFRDGFAGRVPAFAPLQGARAVRRQTRVRRRHRQQRPRYRQRSRRDLQRLVLVARSTALIFPKLIFGRPFWDVVKPLYKPWVPAGLRNRIARALVYIVQGDMAALGFPSTAKKVHATSNANIVNHIHYRRVVVKQGIERIEGRRIAFSRRHARKSSTR